MTVNYKATTVVGTSHLGGNTSKFDTRNTRSTSFENRFCAPVHSRVDAVSADIAQSVEVDFCSKTQFSPGPHQHQSEYKYDSYF